MYITHGESHWEVSMQLACCNVTVTLPILGMIDNFLMTCRVVWVTKHVRYRVVVLKASFDRAPDIVDWL